MSTANNQNGDCKKRVSSHLKSRMDDLNKIWNAYQCGEDSNEYKKTEAEIGNIYEYGLSFDYVAPGTFQGQRRGYWRYQISWGGPSDEFRFFCDENKNCVRIEYWFLDWNDGAKKILTGDNLETMEAIWIWFKDAGSVDSEYDKATNGE